MEIKEVKSIAGIEKELYQLLSDCVESGASVGFLTPINRQEIESYWDSVSTDLALGSRKLFLAYSEGFITGSVQLSLCSKANGSHRGEVEKLMVHTKHRDKGVSKQLMAAMEYEAANLNLSLLVLDTRLGDVASSLYRSVGYTEAGQIPQFARSSNGELESTVYFYKVL
ncbi:N-acetyltransferase family protein [Vibrio cyclitrophicus]